MQENLKKLLLNWLSVNSENNRTMNGQFFLDQINEMLYKLNQSNSSLDIARKASLKQLKKILEALITQKDAFIQTDTGLKNLKDFNNGGYKQYIPATLKQQYQILSREMQNFNETIRRNEVKDIVNKNMIDDLNARIAKEADNDIKNRGYNESVYNAVIKEMLEK